MAKKFLTPIDLGGLEIRNAVIQNLGSDPGSPANGQFWYLTSGGHDVRARVNGASVSLLPTSLLGSNNTWTGTNAFNGAVTGNNTINLTGAGSSSVAGTMGASAFVPAGLTGSVAATRYVGGTASGAPSTGAHAAGDFVVAQDGSIWICTVTGTPGTWVNAGASGNLVTSVAGRAGVVVLTAADIGAGTFPGANTFSGSQTFSGGVVANSAVTGSGTINLTGTGAGSVGGTFGATAFAPAGLAGSVAASRYVGATASGAPSTGAHLVGDYVIAQDGHIFICTSSGTPGTWVDIAGASFPGYGTVTAQASYGLPSGNGVATTVSRSDHVHGTPSLSSSNPAALSIGSTGVPGSVGTASDAGHVHAMPGFAAPTAETTFGTSATTGSAATVPHSDHTHGNPTHDAAAHSAISLSAFAVPSGDLSIGTHKLTNVTDGVAASDAATVGQVISLVNTGNNKAAVRTASTANVAVATALTNGSVMDGVTLATGDRVLLKNQTTPAENGIWVVVAAGAANRATDADISAEVTGGLSVWINEGTVNGDTRWVLTTNNPITLGTTSLTFVQDFAATSVTAGAGLTATGGVLAVGAGTGISVAADTVGIDTAVVARKFTGLIGNGAATSFTVNHGFGNQWVNAQAFDVATFTEIECDITLTDANNTSFAFAVAPASNAIRVVITG